MADPRTFSEAQIAAIPLRAAEMSEILELWRELSVGDRVIVSTGALRRGDFLVLARPERRPTQGPRNVHGYDLLGQVLLGSLQKVIAIDHGLSVPSLARILKQELHRIGLDCTPSRVPEALVLFARAQHERRPFGFQVGTLRHEGTRYEILLRSFSQMRFEELPNAVREVLHLRLRGNSYAEIARARRTSYRTVANQMATASRRLGSSGRLDLLQAVCDGR